MKLTSTILTAVTAVLLACAFSACGNPNGSSGGGNNSSSDDQIVLGGTYAGQLTPSEGSAFTLSISISGSESLSATFRYNSTLYSGAAVTLNGTNFSIHGTKASETCDITGTVSADGTSLSNITIDGYAYSGVLDLEV